MSLKQYAYKYTELERNENGRLVEVVITCENYVIDGYQLCECGHKTGRHNALDNKCVDCACEQIALKSDEWFCEPISLLKDGKSIELKTAYNGNGTFRVIEEIDRYTTNIPDGLYIGGSDFNTSGKRVYWTKI